MTTAFLSQTAKTTQSPIQTGTNFKDGGNGRYLGSRRRRKGAAESTLEDYSFLFHKQDPRMRFDKDPIYTAFDLIDKTSFKSIVKKFFRGEL